MAEKCYWTPKNTESSHLHAFQKIIEKKYEIGFKNYEAFYQWTCDSNKDFWKEFIEFSEIIHTGNLTPVYENSGDQFQSGKWFKNVKLSFAQNLIEKSKDLKTAIIGIDESHQRWEISGTQLVKEVSKVQSFLKKMNVKKGTVVAGVLSNIPETIIAMLAANSLGAIWTCSSPDFGINGLVERFSQSKPEFMFLCEHYYYAGKKIALSDKNSEILKLIPSVKNHYVIRKNNSYAFCDLEDANEDRLEYELCDFNHPLYIMYSSGTTGKPKCMVHGVGGTLIQHLKEHLLHCDLRPNEKLLYYTTCGWMMWNWLVSALASQTTVVCYDGSPGHPKLESLWELADQEELEHFGTSAKYISACRLKSLDLKQSYSFKKLRTIYSTGSPLSPEDFDYVYKDVAPNAQLASICGGTDILSCFMLGNPMKKVIRGEIQGRGLGMSVEAFDENGKATRNNKGELVCTKPFPSMPLNFWNDVDGKKYQDAYFSKFENIWHHGDYISINDDGGIVVYGRSDSTLNPSGVRIGTAELYQAVESFPGVEDSLAVGQKWQNDERIVMFVKLNNIEYNNDFVDSLKIHIKDKLTSRHVPAVILEVNSIPYTISGKKVEKAIKLLMHDEEPSNQDALKNPEAIEEFRKIINESAALKS